MAASRRARGHEQREPRFGVVVQADELLALSTILLSPTSTRARPATFRPEIEIAGRSTRVLVEQASVVDPDRLGRSAGRLSPAEMRDLDEALALVFGLAVWTAR